MKHRGLKTIACTGLLLVSACSPVKTETTGTDGNHDIPLPNPDPEVTALVPEDVASDGVLTVITADGMAPLNIPDAATGKIEGFNPDLATHVAALMGLETDIHASPFDQIIPGLQAGRYEVTFSNMAISDERREVLDFVHYYQSSTSLGVLEGRENEVTPETLCGRKVGASAGSYQMTTVLPEEAEKCEQIGAPELETAAFPDQQKALLALLSQRVDATAVDAPVLSYAASQETRLVENGKLTQGSTLGIGVTKGSDLSKAIEMAMKKLMENGGYDRLLEKYSMQDQRIESTEIEG
ncbi:transporter substrate-binding domain-containing protein [Corynebacterium frankenforstense]|uniref:transporter substrate-binding domain-containing protein n=1 Tax=Corynebacterium TaxID=1716 RepID=UPI00254EB27B|nr:MULTISPECIES: transporter substrate-binding domain-containing protein [Corynebacterium]MDK6259632.1 transporter substrate-binding domain-containing protein [Corynebacterium frankenforstense]MDK8894830.1 transporter substrate-binding domain-containing protein [Corynebacterium sp. MSK006]